MSSILIENIVATCALGSELDLDALAMALAEAEYDPEHFHALVFRDTKNKGSLLVNASGIVVAVGFKSESSLEDSLDDFIRVLRENGYRVSRGPVEVRNLVVSTDLSRGLDLVRIASTFPGAEYEPEQFPGVIIRFGDTKATLLVFGSGKIICVGATSQALAEKAIADISREL